MATKSITKTINIKTEAACKSLVRALERSEIHVQKPVQTRAVEHVKSEDIKKLFGDKK